VHDNYNKASAWNAAARWDFKSMKTINGIKQAPPALRALTQHLLAHGRSSEVQGGEQTATDCICQKLGHHLVQVLGNLGFEALLTRALALAKMEVPALQEVELVTGQGVERCVSSCKRSIALLQRLSQKPKNLF
jgi:hypothetical protein